MHKTEGLDNVGNMFDPGDPLAPRLGTELDYRWANAVQKELTDAIEGAGVVVRTRAADVSAGYGGQLLQAIQSLIGRRAGAVLRINKTTGSITQEANNGLASVGTLAWDSQGLYFDVTLTGGGYFVCAADASFVYANPPPVSLPLGLLATALALGAGVVRIRLYKPDGDPFTSGGGGAWDTGWISNPPGYDIRVSLVALGV